MEYTDAACVLVARTRSPLKDLLLPLHYIRRFASSADFVSALLELLVAPLSIHEDLSLPDVETALREKFEARIWAEEGLQILRQKETLARALMVCGLPRSGS